MSRASEPEPAAKREASMTIRQIATMAGVSTATVSRVLHGSNLVAAETGVRIRRIIDELQFTPDSNAATLKSGRSNTFGLLIPDITNPFFSEFIKSFEAIAIRKDYEMLLACIDFDSARMQQSVRRMLTRRVNGVVLMASEIDTGPFESLAKNYIPLITMDRMTTGEGLSDIAIDYPEAMLEGVAYLKELGHREIGFIGGPPEIRTSRVRMEAFRAGMEAVELPVREEFLRHGDYRIPGGKQAMAELLSLRRRPTAIMTGNDLTAIGALLLLRDRGFDVPRDISIIGFDDIELSQIVSPPLTTLHTSRDELAALFFTALESEAPGVTIPGQQYDIKAQLVIRGSTAPPPTARRKLAGHA